MTISIHELMDTLPQVGKVIWLGVRPAKSAPMVTHEEVEIKVGQGIVGDRFKATRTDREITLIQSEHIIAMGSLLGHDAPTRSNGLVEEQKNNSMKTLTIDPSILRRNIVVEGINLLALKGKQFQLGTVVLEYTGLAHPCSKMELALGAGGYNAMRGHGGITARVISSGVIKRHDRVVVRE